MSWCPACKNEYREGFTNCSECNRELVEVLIIKENSLQTANSLKKTKIIRVGYMVYQGLVLLIVPSLIIFSLLICSSEELQRIVIPNPPLSMLDEMQNYTLFFCFYNYVFLFINYLIRKKYLELLEDKNKWIKGIFRIYMLLNTMLFIYYAYITYVYIANVNYWHFFKIY